jgi:signal transduction histidine kinase
MLLPALLVTDPDDARAGQAPRTTRDWVVDVLIFVIAVALGVFMYWLTATQHRTPAPVQNVADIVITVLACVGLWWRRRWPVVLAVLCTLGGVVSGYCVGALIAYMFTVAVHRRFTVTAAVAVLGVVTAVPYNMINPDPTTSFAESMTWTVGIIAVVTAWGMLARARRQLVVSLRDRAERAEEEQQLRADQARRAERTRIAREMHDVLAHRISLLSTYAGALEYRKGGTPEEVASAASVIRASAHQALQDLREVIGVLRADSDPGGDPGEPSERPQPTAADLPGLVDESRAAGSRVTFTSGTDLAEVPSAVGRTAYRIVQEGLTNARKHAPGTAVAVEVGGAAGDGLTVEVRNRLPVGAVRSPIPGAGAGLVGMSERATLAGGRLDCGPTTDGDFSLRAWLPWTP